mgnify:CR=1 FL=1
MPHTTLHFGLTLDAYIEELLKLRSQHGGTLRVQKWMPAKGRHGAPIPVLAHERTYDKHPDHGGAAFFNAEHDNPVQKGDPVIRV